jgi:hypothetical protein
MAFLHVVFSLGIVAQAACHFKYGPGEGSDPPSPDGTSPAKIIRFR